jgi:5'(3')-deoxyribonucleotidase
MAVDHILIDMDGVLCDFLSPVLDLFGFPMDEYPAGEWNVEDVLRVSKDDVWRCISEVKDFWLNLKPYPWYYDLLDRINRTRIPWTVATKPARDPECAKQKIQWMKKHIQPEFGRYMVGRQKFLLAGPGRLLIDDSDENVNRFVECGGQAILLPQRWNSRHDYTGDKMAFLNAALETVL